MAHNLPRIIIGAASSGSGKTTITCGILKALKNRGVRVSAFKCGPDYIDPMFHESVLGIPSKNLDCFFCSDELIKKLFYKQAKHSGLSVIEGVMGYYDGIAMDKTQASTYHLAKTLQAPVVLVINAKGMALTAASLIKGVMEYKNDSNIRAVILNNTSKQVYTALKPIIEEELNINVIGYLPYSEECAFESRHLGLLTPDSIKNLYAKTEKLGLLAEECIDIDRLINIANKADNLNIALTEEKKENRFVKIGIARDNAFCFYYKDNLELLESFGCEIHYFSPLKDNRLPENIDGIILGGGYPELYCRELSSNKAMLADIRQQLEKGLPCLAECGGFMYLHKTVEDKNKNCFDMAGIIDSNAFYCGKLVRFGYITLSAMDNCYVCNKGEQIKAHEFHYWDSTDNGNMFKAEKPGGSRSWDCIHQYKNVICGYPHIFYYSNPGFAEGFVAKCVEYKESRQCLQ